MASHEVICAVLHYLTSHKWGPPHSKDVIINRAGLSSDQLGEAKEAVEELRRDAPFIEDHGNRGIAIDQHEYKLLADYMYYSCDMDQEDVDQRLKHYEGIENHDWGPDVQEG